MLETFLSAARGMRGGQTNVKFCEERKIIASTKEQSHDGDENDDDEVEEQVEAEEEEVKK